MLNKRFGCLRCGHTWSPHYPKIGALGYAPAQCPSCGSRDWQRPKHDQTHCPACGKELNPAPRNLGELEVRIGAAILELGARPDEYIPGAPCWDLSITEVAESLGVEPSRRLYNEIAHALRSEGWRKYQRRYPDGRRSWRFRKMFPPPAPEKAHAQFPKLRPAEPPVFAPQPVPLTAEKIRSMMEYATDSERAELRARLEASETPQ